MAPTLNGNFCPARGDQLTDEFRVEANAGLAALMLVASCGSSSTSGESTGAAATTVSANTEGAASTSASTPVTDASASSSPTEAAHTVYPLTITNCGRQVTFTEAPKRVVILNGTSVGEVETFVALGLQGSIAANSQSYGVSDDPSMVAEIAAIPTGGLKLNENYEVPREEVLAQKPDLVISTWAGGYVRQSVRSPTISSMGSVSTAMSRRPTAAYGATDPTAADVATLKAQSYKSSYDLISDLGKIFDVQDRGLGADRRIRGSDRGREPNSWFEAGPRAARVSGDVDAMNANGLPAVFGGSLYDSIIDAAGGVNSFPGMEFTERCPTSTPNSWPRPTSMSW